MLNNREMFQFYEFYILKINWPDKKVFKPIPIITPMFKTDNNTSFEITDNNTPIQKVQFLTKTMDGVLLSVFKEGCY